MELSGTKKEFGIGALIVLAIGSIVAVVYNKKKNKTTVTNVVVPLQETAQTDSLRESAAQ